MSTRLSSRVHEEVSNSQRREDGTEMQGEGTPLRELWVLSPHLVWIRAAMTSHTGFLKLIDTDVNLPTGEQRRIAVYLIQLNRDGHIRRCHIEFCRLLPYFMGFIERKVH